MISLTEAENALKSVYIKMLAEELTKSKKKNPICEKVIHCGDKPYKSNKSKIGRNSLCPCGSGKKYKKCCLGACRR